jgi:phospholipid/cholesterol/gamma-HCH transport system permease protein
LFFPSAIEHKTDKSALKQLFDKPAPEDMGQPGILLRPLNVLGKSTTQVIREIGRISIFFAKGLFFIFHTPFQLSKIIHQIYFIGMKSMFVVCLTGAFTGMVLGLQGYYSLAKFGSTGFLGPTVALSLIRELGPVLAAVMVTGRAGSAMAAEIGIMRISEQIDALETMDINPIRFLISPKIAAALISLPLLTAMFDVVGILGGYFTATILLDMNPVIYFSRIEASVALHDISGGFVKSIVFAIVVVTISCYQGYTTHLRDKGFGAEGVSFSTTTAVVQSCVLILITDYIITSFLL